MRIVVGLGNPGEKYLRNYHNLGFMAAEAASQKLGVKLKKRECQSLTAVVQRGGQKAVLATPQTYMNLSGEAVKGLMKKYGARPEDILILYDEADIEPCAIRIRQSGSGGSHNGMCDIVAALGTENVPRLRIGIGRPVDERPLHDHVLSDIPQHLREPMFQTILKAADAAVEFLGGADVETLMLKYNGK
ncbi:MAG: aminoacyl-tRNA hydrolase [Firmicutes bacterium]|nr:aminoacyl-tRNA hydrolase [Bacillota bacterium]